MGCFAASPPLNLACGRAPPSGRATRMTDGEHNEMGVAHPAGVRETPGLPPSPFSWPFPCQTAIKRNNPRKFLRSVGDGETVEFDVVEGEKVRAAAGQGRLGWGREVPISAGQLAQARGTGPRSPEEHCSAFATLASYRRRPSRPLTTSGPFQSVLHVSPVHPPPPPPSPPARGSSSSYSGRASYRGGPPRRVHTQAQAPGGGQETQQWRSCSKLGGGLAGRRGSRFGNVGHAGGVSSLPPSPPGCGSR